MSILKNSILFIFLLFTMMVKAQTVIDFIRMIDTTYQPYQEGEHWATDSLIDIKNGYYQRGFSFEGEQGIVEKILRQVAVFANNDGTKTIVETISYYDFVCWVNTIKFYYYNGETLQFVDNSDHFLPTITEEDLLSEKALFIFKKLYRKANRNQYITLSGTIKNAYDIRYVLPRYGTKIMVHLDFCDHFDPDINLAISEEDYNIIENGTVPIKLSYDKEYKQFVK
jgi:hypothetical protein